MHLSIPPAPLCSGKLPFVKGLSRHKKGGAKKKRQFIPRPLDKLLCGYPASFCTSFFPSFLPILFSFCFGYNSKSLEGYLDATSRIYILFMVSSKAFIFYRLFFHLQEPVISADEIIFLALQLLPAGGQKGADRKIRPISV